MDPIHDVTIIVGTNKKPRLTLLGSQANNIGNDAGSFSSSSDTCNDDPSLQLSPQLWARALDYLWMDDVLHCSIVNRFFWKEVAPHVTYLWIRQSRNLVGTLARQRFAGVQNVHIFSLVKGCDESTNDDNDNDDEEEEDDDDDEDDDDEDGDDGDDGEHEGIGDHDVVVYAAADAADNDNHDDESDDADDSNTVQFIRFVSARTCLHLVPFLSSFPNLNYAFVGGFFEKDPSEMNNQNSSSRSRSYYRKEEYGPHIGDCSYRPDDHMVIVAAVQQQICEAYAFKRLDSKVTINGLWRPQTCNILRKGYWDEYSRSLHRYPHCHFCNTICRILPVEQIIQPDFGAAACLPENIRMEIAWNRDEKGRVLKRPGRLDELLWRSLVERTFGIRFRYRFDPSEGFKWRTSLALKYDDDKYIDWLIQKGANPQHPKVREILVESREPPHRWRTVPFGYDKDAHATARRRVFSRTLASFVKWNMDVSENDFEVLT